MKAIFFILALCVLLGLSQAFPSASPEADPSRRFFGGGFGYGRPSFGGYYHSHAFGNRPHSHHYSPYHGHSTTFYGGGFGGHHGGHGFYG